MKPVAKATAVTLAGILVTVVAGLIAIPRLITDADSSERPLVRSSTTRVERRDLVERASLNGTLAFADRRSLLARAGGTLTGFPREGAVVRRGRELYEIDRRSIHLLFGRVPAYRTLSAGVSEGPDVAQLERNLIAMGYDPYDAIELDAEFDADTSAAIERWQDDLEVEETGTLELGTFEFLPGPRRMGEILVEIGAPVAAGTHIADTTSTEREVFVSIDAASRPLVRTHKRVRVESPDGRMIAGRITSIGKVAQTPSEAEGGSDPKIEVLISLDKDKAAGMFDQAPVIVSIVSAREKDVLAVPVAALVALAEGGFALEVPSAQGSRLVEVTPATYADGWVEVSGAGIEEGLEVVVPDGA